MSKSEEPLGIQLREMRRQAHCSAKELARLAGVSRGHLSQIEHGKKMPSMAVLGRLAQALGVTTSQLLHQTQDDVHPWALMTLQESWPMTAEEYRLLADIQLAGVRPRTPDAYLLLLLAMRQACAGPGGADVSRETGRG